MKVGRNNPCPCGSGKKYKKCCVHKQEVATGNPILPLNYRWTEEKVNKLDSDAIMDNLTSFGIPITVDDFKRVIRNVSSVGELLFKWEKLYHLNTNDSMIDFTFLAIKVLASRLAPTHLLLEQIDDLMLEGYNDEQLNHEERAVEKWMEVWEKTLLWLGDTQLTDIRELNDRTRPLMSQFYSNWVQDFEMALANAGRSDVRYATMRKDFTNDFLEKFPDSDSLIIQNMTVAKGESLFYLGGYEESEVVFQEYIQKNPDNFWPYVLWGDLYNPEMQSKMPNKERSISLYKKAINKALDKYDREAVEERLHELTND
ncbi:SEC-C metal-binding domain-containing protein [Lentibacillus sp. Marseille-P4043]|uniref:SEC-C metal-binding domain-containing protein n=1 Tax=Lentibacillus sp. Marseille-P4043 TaxID=2040293 RepID=UPI000D0B31EE|nr:SEC-C metal-binding domain-containing protein [Lentibacillus sp. Marseille-P4043]